MLVLERHPNLNCFFCGDNTDYILVDVKGDDPKGRGRGRVCCSAHLGTAIDELKLDRECEASHE